MTNQNITLQNYAYQQNRPIFISHGYRVYEGTQKLTDLPVTIKIINNYQVQLPKYLRKIKETKSENVIKILEIVFIQFALILITERVVYGNLSTALQRCRRLDDADSIFIAKLILNGHLDLLRNQCNWFGTEQDIQFTISGLKLSWNNSMPYNTFNPFPKILQRISLRPENKFGVQAFLPFPKNRGFIELINLSLQNATEISFHHQMKKKQKQTKRVGKDWISLKQSFTKNQYYDEYVYLAVSQQYGFLRVKMYQKGKLQSDVLEVYKNNQKFAKILYAYHEKNRTYLVSEYSNDGNLHSYFSKLIAANITLSQQQIEYIFYSLMEPLKIVQQSPAKSINMLHIKNIYLHDGVPIIGEPIPLNEMTKKTLMQRVQAPDFYHPDFKRDPNSHDQKYDTYSLGVLLYKLMYTQYPIFPKGLVHIPTYPSYNARLKKTIQILLNLGGNLKSLEKKIQVGEKAEKQVRQDQLKLAMKMAKQKQKKQHKVQELQMQASTRPILKNNKVVDENYENEDEKQKEIASNNNTQPQNPKLQQNYVKQQRGFAEWIQNLCYKLFNETSLQAQEPVTKSLHIRVLEQTHYKPHRIIIKTFLVVCLYVFLFYFFFLKADFALIRQQSLFKTFNATTDSGYYPIITPNWTYFQTELNKTNHTIQSVKGMGCLICNLTNVDYSKLLYANSPGWIGYLVAAAVSFIIIIMIKIWQIFTFDIVKAIHTKQNDPKQYPISNWIIFNLSFCCLIFGHFYLFNYIYNGYIWPCVGTSYMYGSTYTLFNDMTIFKKIYITTACFQIGVVLLQCVMIGLSTSIKYTRAFNPIIIFGSLLITQWLICRIGVINGYFYPNVIQDKPQGNIILKYFINFTTQYTNVFGIVPQILLFFQLLLGFIVDMIFYYILNRRRLMLLSETSTHSLYEV